jgi:hypothetical protein
VLKKEIKKLPKKIFEKNNIKNFKEMGKNNE